MKSSDAAKLPTITDALTSLRNQGLAIGVEILKVDMTVSEKPVQFAWDPSTSEWQIAAQ